MANKVCQNCIQNCPPVLRGRISATGRGLNAAPTLYSVGTNTSILGFQHFNFQLMHTTLKNVELLKHFKISKIAPTCFGLQGNHHQGATIST